MKFLIFLCGSFLVLITCHAAVRKKYFSDNVQNYFVSHFEPDFPPSISGQSEATESVGKLTTSLLHDIYNRAGKRFNIVLSPISIWATLALLLEGAGGRTENELKTKLQVSYQTHEEGKHMIRNIYNELTNFNQGRNFPTEFTSINFVVSDKTKLITPEYKNIIRQYYNGRHFEIDSRESDKFSKIINMWASQATKHRITSISSPGMLSNILLIVGNAVYFKSKWKYPFDPSQTIVMPFKDEYGKPIKNVPMMNQVAVLPYAYNAQLESEILEIPYADGLTSMVVILPGEKINIGNVLSKMRHIRLDKIIPQNFTEETVQLTIPRFYIINKVYLNNVLKQDLQSVFSPQYAEFPHIGKNIFVSKVTHQAEIENNEEGSTASATTSVQFAYKSSSIAFRANRPFIYLINEMKTRTVLFAGTYSNPFNA